MSAKGRPEREYRSAQHEGKPVGAPGRPMREYRSAQHEGNSVIAWARLQPDTAPPSTTGRLMAAPR
jgi:hypothetical protein